MSKTNENLMAAFAGESQANRKYLAFATQAETEGLTQVAKLFRAAAEAETIHALRHFKNAGNIGTTAENLKAAIAGENFENTKMYPEMIADAKAEGNTVAAGYMEWVNEVEAVHEKLYTAALANPTGMASVDYYLCPVCGYTHEGAMSEDCPVCKASASKFYATK